MTAQVDVRRAGMRSGTRLGWLDSKHSFSFGRSYDPANTHHGLLLVNNDDTVKPGTGFETHPHRDMEIVTWVLQGSLVHQDSEGHTGVILSCATFLSGQYPHNHGVLENLPPYGYGAMDFNHTIYTSLHDAGGPDRLGRQGPQHGRAHLRPPARGPGFDEWLVPLAVHRAEHVRLRGQR